MNRCPDCGKPVKSVKLIEGGEVVLDNSQSAKGPNRYFIDYEREGETVPVAVGMSDASPHFGYPTHESVCVKAQVRR